MRNQPSNPPYFDGLFQRLAGRDPTTVAAFGRHVHWGYWADPAGVVCSAVEYGEAAERLCRTLCDTAKLHDRMRILDVGCGFGGTIASLNERLQESQLVGINIDTRQLQRAVELVRPCNGNTIEFIQADASELPLPANSCDAVLAVECIFHFDREGFIAEAKRVLRPGGNLTLSDFVPSERALEYLDTFATSANEAIRGSYGDIDLTCSLSRYQALAETNGLVLTEAIDINENTMPTYDFLYKTTAGWTNAREIEMFTRATRWLYKACRNGTLAYQILRFDHTSKE